jgi:predicted amidohydrolase YtcJ
LNNFFTQIHDLGYDVAAHTNGDAAIDNYLSAVAYARANSVNASSEGRFILFHAQTAR